MKIHRSHESDSDHSSSSSNSAQIDGSSIQRSNANSRPMRTIEERRGSKWIGYKKDLKVSSPEDASEKEADTVAKQVVNRQSTDEPIAQKREELNPQAEEVIQPMEEEVSPMSEAVATMPEVGSVQTMADASGDDEAIQAKDKQSLSENREDEQHSSYGGEDESNEDEQHSSYVSRKASGGDRQSITDENFHHELANSKAGGMPMDATTLAAMNQSFGTDFSGVHIHTDQRADELCKQANAKAFAHGQDIYFRKGNYQPNTAAGKELLAHELTHTVQQRVGENQVQRTDIGPTEDAKAYLPDEAELLTKMRGKTISERKSKIDTYLITVKARWNELKKLGGTDEFKRVRLSEKEMATSTVKPISGVPSNRPTYYRDRMMYDAGGLAATKIGRNLVFGTVKTSTYAASAELTVEAIMNLRRFDDVLIRMISIQKVHSDTNIDIEKVAALYRIEGNLGVSPSKSSLDSDIPSGTTAEETSLGNPPDISNGVILFKSSYSGYSDLSLKEFGLKIYFVQLIGLDQVGAYLGSGTGNALRDSFASWSYNNWKKAGQSDTLDSAKKRWTDLLALLKITKPSSDSGTSSAVQITTTDPVKLLTAIVKEGAILNQRLESVGDFLGSDTTFKDESLSDGMNYARYNLAPQKFQRMIMSAIISASKSSDKNFLALKTAITSSTDLAALIKETNPKDSYWSNVKKWLKADQSNLNMISNYVETAGTTEWKSWTKPRGNMSRYIVLKEYYSKVFN